MESVAIFAGKSQARICLWFSPALPLMLDTSAIPLPHFTQSQTHQCSDTSIFLHLLKKGKIYEYVTAASESYSLEILFYI